MPTKLTSVEIPHILKFLPIVDVSRCATINTTWKSTVIAQFSSHLKFSEFSKFVFNLRDWFVVSLWKHQIIQKHKYIQNLLPFLLPDFQGDRNLEIFLRLDLFARAIGNLFFAPEYTSIGFGGYRSGSRANRPGYQIVLSDPGTDAPMFGNFSQSSNNNTFQRVLKPPKEATRSAQFNYLSSWWINIADSLMNINFDTTQSFLAFFKDTVDASMELIDDEKPDVNSSKVEKVAQDFKWTEEFLYCVVMGVIIREKFDIVCVDSQPDFFFDAIETCLALKENSIATLLIKENSGEKVNERSYKLLKNHSIKSVCVEFSSVEANWERTWERTWKKLNLENHPNVETLSLKWNLEVNGVTPNGAVTTAMIQPLILLPNHLKKFEGNFWFRGWEMKFENIRHLEHLECQGVEITESFCMDLAETKTLKTFFFEIDDRLFKTVHQMPNMLTALSSNQSIENLTLSFASSTFSKAFITPFLKACAQIKTLKSLALKFPMKVVDVHQDELIEGLTEFAMICPSIESFTFETVQHNQASTGVWGNQKVPTIVGFLHEFAYNFAVLLSGSGKVKFSVQNLTLIVQTFVSSEFVQSLHKIGSLICFKTLFLKSPDAKSWGVPTPDEPFKSDDLLSNSLKVDCFSIAPPTKSDFFRLMKSIRLNDSITALEIRVEQKNSTLAGNLSMFIAEERSLLSIALMLKDHPSLKSVSFVFPSNRNALMYHMEGGNFNGVIQTGFVFGQPRFCNLDFVRSTPSWGFNSFQFQSILTTTPSTLEKQQNDTKKEIFNLFEKGIFDIDKISSLFDQKK